ncbi:unnamed protein product [Cylicocyclus nassatus]|uniref:Uncharacterized protein n=1 Tax=Cylicocyclus nassatus TaxID=53992 RepID=A0AA36MB77_CYLNA|nr:unnamed protein product [Cylicocyclus nassatus]
MRCVVVILAAVTVLAYAQVQNTGYETAEQVQPAPAPISASGGDQQAYNSDAAAPVAPASPLPPPPPPPPSPPAPVRESYASPPPPSWVLTTAWDTDVAVFSVTELAKLVSEIMYHKRMR